jgi:hypothetical protein
MIHDMAGEYLCGAHVVFFDVEPEAYMLQIRYLINLYPKN